jgi:hypothetical protein
MRETMLLALDTRPVIETGSFSQRDFVTSEEELPAAVSMTEDAPAEAATRITDVKTETTDDN